MQRNSLTRKFFRYLCIPCTRDKQASSAGHLQAYSTATLPQRTATINDATNPFFNYTSGRWLYNEHLRLAERTLHFDVNKLCDIVAKATGLDRSAVALLTKIAEGGSYRIFEATFHNGLKVIARLPYPCSLPRTFGVASEVATMEYLRIQGIPVPKVLDWSSSSCNALGSEYIIMERVSGKELTDTWYTMTFKERMAIVKKIVDVENLLFNLRFPACGSLFFKSSLDHDMQSIDLPNAAGFCIGPSTEYLWWYQKRNEIGANGGPWRTSEEVLKSVGEREILWLQKFGQRRYPREPFCRELYGGQKVDPQVQINHLSDYVAVAPHLVPKSEELNKPTIRHPDLSPSNIFTSDSGDITGIIDWQHATILPIFLQAKIPKHFQNYGDDDSENFHPPKLAEGFAAMSNSDKKVEMELYRRRQVHYFYLGYTSELNKAHFHAMGKHNLILRNQLYDVAGRPWEGDNTSLQAQLMRVMAQWSEIDPEQDPPIHYSPAEVEECLDRDERQTRVHEQMQHVRDFIGINIDGLVLNEEYEGARERARLIKVELAEETETEEQRKEFDRIWPFQDHEELD